MSAEMVVKAAESLELSDAKPSRFGWFRRRASVVVTAVGATVSLAVAGSLIAPVLRAAATAPPATESVPASDELPATSSEPPATSSELRAASETLVAEPVIEAPAPAVVEPAAPPQEVVRRYTVLAASFPVTEVAREGSAASTRLELVTSRLRSLGHNPWLADVDLKARGEWRRVLVGEFSTLDEAKRQANELHQAREFSDAQPIRY